MNCTAAPAAYKLWREQIPIGEDEIAELGLAMFREAIDGCKELPKDLTKNIEFEAVVFGSHMGASQLLVQMGRPHEARRLLEDFLRLYSHFPAGRLQQAQRYLEAIFFGSLDLSATPLDDALNQVDSVSEWSDRTVSEQDRPPPSRSKIHPTAPEKGRVSSTEKGGDRGLRRAWVTVIAGAGVAIGVIFGLVKRSRFRRSKKTEHCH